ncbi:MAG: phosphodiesterase [Salinibacter sp.]
MSVELLQLTDLHLLADPADTILGVPPRTTLRKVVAEARTHAWDLALLTGDLSQDGTPTAYEGVRKLVDPLDTSFYWVPGNHDQPAVMDRTLDTSPFRTDRAFGVGAWRVVMLDTALLDETHGRLSAEELAFLEESLSAYPNRPTLVAMHHSPVPVGSDWLDPLNLRQPGAFRQIIEAHPQVRLVLFGHVHQQVDTRWGDTHLYGCPSTCFQFAPESEEFRVEDADPGYRRVGLQDDGGFDVSLHRVEAPHIADLEADGY